MEEATSSSAASRRISCASAASSSSVSSVTLALAVADPSASVGWPASLMPDPLVEEASAAAATADGGGTYSFLHPPRATTARNRTPPSIQSNAEYPSPVPSGSSASPSTVSSLDSLTNALAEYPAFGGATQSPLGSQSSVSSAEGGGSARGTTGLYGASLEEALLRSRLVIQKVQAQSPPQQHLKVVAPYGEIDQEPWRGAWDQPSPHRAVIAGSTSDGAATITNLGRSVCVDALSARGLIQPQGLEGEPSERTEAAGSQVGQERNFGIAATGTDDDIILDNHSSSRSQGSGGESARPQLPNFAEDALRQWGAAAAETGDDVRAPDEQPDQQPLQQLSPSLRRRMHGLQPLTLSIWAPAGDQTSSGSGASPRAANERTVAGSTISKDTKLGDWSAAARTSVMVEDWPLPFAAQHEGVPAEAVGVPVVRVEVGADPVTVIAGGTQREDVPRRRSSGVVATGVGTAGGGGGGGISCGGGLSEELLSDLLLWTVSDFFSSPRSGSSSNAES